MQPMRCIVAIQLLALHDDSDLQRMSDRFPFKRVTLFVPEDLWQFAALLDRARIQ